MPQCGRELQVLVPVTLFQFFDNLPNGLFVFFAGDERGILGMNHDAVVQP